MIKRNTSTIMVACALSALSFTATVQANCSSNPADIVQSEAGKYAKVYVQEADNIGSSWRLYVRPRNKSSLKVTGHGFMSPVGTPGQTDGKGQSASISPGTKNGDDDYKSRMSVDIPSGQAIYNTYTALKSDGTMSKQPTMIGYNIATSKGSGYSGQIFVIPMTKTDGSYDNANSKVLVLCIK